MGWLPGVRKAELGGESTQRLGHVGRPSGNECEHTRTRGFMQSKNARCRKMTEKKWAIIDEQPQCSQKGAETDRGREGLVPLLG